MKGLHTFVFGFVVYAGCVLMGCNRLPTGRMPSAQIAEFAVASASEPEAAEPGEAPSRVTPARNEPMNVLCTKACQHWVTLRFADPVGIDQAEGTPAVAEILTLQHTLNEEKCAKACLRRGDGARRRAECILDTATPDQAEACAQH